MKEKTPLSREVVCFQMLDFETSKSNSEVSKSNGKLCLLKNYVISEGAVPLTMFYIINISPLLVTK